MKKIVQDIKMKARPIKELFRVVLSEGDKEFKNSRAFGICGFLGNLLLDLKINDLEYSIIRKYIKKNRPKPGDKHYRPSYKLISYYWRTEAWGPRRNWIKDQIKKL